MIFPGFCDLMMIALCEFLFGYPILPVSCHSEDTVILFIHMIHNISTYGVDMALSKMQLSYIGNMIHEHRSKETPFKYSRPHFLRV